ncbi:MAG: hypothetical protein JNG89_19395 [Planctomycetaceae bacterium]|nr:hypothetical protein [Planctomycetaceae bacterium]
MVRRMCWLGAMIVIAQNSALSADPAALLADPAERAAIVSSVGKTPAVEEYKQGKRVLLCALAPLADSGSNATDAAAGLIEALYYRYDDGTTLKATFDPASNATTAVVLEAYPTPLADEEFQKALEVADSQLAAFKAVRAGRTDDEVVVDYLVPIYSNRTSPLFGKRVVILTAYPTGAPEKRIQATVNLSDETLVTLPDARRP